MMGSLHEVGLGAHFMQGSRREVGPQAHLMQGSRHEVGPQAHFMQGWFHEAGLGSHFMAQNKVCCWRCAVQVCRDKDRAWIVRSGSGASFPTGACCLSGASDAPPSLARPH